MGLWLYGIFAHSSPQLPRMALWSRAPCALREICEHGVWPNRSSRPAVPLSRIHTAVLRLLASHRNPESYVAGSTPLNRDALRFSADIDVFHDREELVARASTEDAAVL